MDVGDLGKGYLSKLKEKKWKKRNWSLSIDHCQNCEGVLLYWAKKLVAQKVGCSNQERFFKRWKV